MTRLGAGQQQVCEIRARDQQHEPDRRLQDPNRATGAAKDHVLHRLHLKDVGERPAERNEDSVSRAETDTSSPIYGMPVLQVWKAGKVVMLKRGMSAGYAGVDNPLVYNDNTAMLFGDARSSVQKLLAALRERSA